MKSFVILYRYSWDRRELQKREGTNFEDEAAETRTTLFRSWRHFYDTKLQNQKNPQLASSPS